MNDAVKRGLGLLFGIIAILVLFLFGLVELRTPSNPMWMNLAIGLGALVISFIIGKVMYNSIRSGFR